MNDKELLELAAKAVNQPIEFTDGVPVPFIEDGVVFAAWNPLTDDGDALRLAVKLKLMVSIGGVLLDGVHVQSTGEFIEVVKEPYGDDPYAATRRAIVRAAAAIGKTEAITVWDLDPPGTK